MSTQRVRKVSKIVLQYTATFANNILSVTTNANHFLATGNVVSLRFQNSPQEINFVSVIVTGATTFDIADEVVSTTLNAGFSSGPISDTSLGGTTSQTGSQTSTANPEWGMSVRKYAGQVVIDYYNAGMTGGQPSFTIPRGQGDTNAVMQSFVTGTGGATYTLELSQDGIHWITAVATVTHAGTTGDTAFVTISPAWAYGRINLSVIGAATTLTVLLGS